MEHDIVSVSRSVTLSAPIHDVWGVAGEFHGLHKWHPGVIASTPQAVGSEVFRLLTLADGGRIVEHLEAEGTHFYRYAILRGPLPVARYHALFEADQLTEGTRLVWSSHFVPTEPGAEAVIAGIYDAGLAALAGRFGG